jgi:hypothetical protein
MERIVRQVERELGVRVQRMDILREPAAEAVLKALTRQRTPPFLYHRESCQIVHVTPGRGHDKKKKKNVNDIYIDKNRVRAWAKGRLLTKQTDTMQDATKVNAPVLIRDDDDDDTAMEQEELLQDMALTKQQRIGKRRIQERTEAKATTTDSKE